MGRKRLELSEMTEQQRKNREKNERAKMRRVHYETQQQENKPDPRDNIVHREVNNIRPHNKLDDLEVISYVLKSPSFYMHLIPASILGFYLGHQGYKMLSQFMDFQDAIFSAVIAEVIALICAVCIPLAKKGFHRGLLVIILISGFGLSTIFLHNGLNTAAYRQTTYYVNAEKKRDAIQASINQITTMIDKLPANHVKRKEKLMNDKKLYFADLKEIDSISSSNHKASLIPSGVIFYNLWVRLSAMICCAILLHALVLNIVSRINKFNCVGINARI
jgi:hypothetical protein